MYPERIKLGNQMSEILQSQLDQLTFDLRPMKGANQAPPVSPQFHSLYSDTDRIP